MLLQNELSIWQNFSETCRVRFTHRAKSKRNGLSTNLTILVRRVYPDEQKGSNFVLHRAHYKV